MEYSRQYRYKNGEVYVEFMTEQEKNELLQCVIDFGYVDTDNIKQLNERK